MRDIEPDEFENINFIRNTFIESAKIFNFLIMEPSPLELLTTLEAKSGPLIINEVYNFTDKGGRDVALRFDLTIGLTRYFSLRRDLKLPAKIASFGGVWRYDEPQAGRYRFFHQWDIEVYGPSSIESDAEIIEFTSMFLDKLGLKNIIIEINSRTLIEEYIKNILKVSDKDKIFEVFRAIDKIPKKGKDVVILEYQDKIGRDILDKVIEFANNRGSFDEVNKLVRPYSLESWIEIERIIMSLTNRGINNVNINLGIVRGLDYYSGVVFEAVDIKNNFGAIVGGGRYNNLTETFGRKDTGATGAAGGVERIILAMKNQSLIFHSNKNKNKNLNFIVFDSEELFTFVEHTAARLRRMNVPIEYDFLKRSFSKQINDAEVRGCENIIIVKKEEYEKDGNITIRNTTHNMTSRIKISENFDEVIIENFKKMSG
jgi:histidyl-tRNA synthetase